MPLNINLPTNHVDGDTGHTAGHNATNTALNAVGAAVDAMAVVTTNTQTGTTYTLALADAGAVVEMNNSSAMTVTVPPHSSVAFPAGTVIELCRLGTGTLTVAAGGGVTLLNPSSLTARAQYSTISLRQRPTTDVWVVSGDLT